MELQKEIMYTPPTFHPNLISNYSVYQSSLSGYLILDFPYFKKDISSTNVMNVLN